MSKPDFIIGGAARSGTSSLNRWLSHHPGVEMAPGKEVRFFDRHYERGLDWYRHQLPNGALVGEASPRYLTHPDAAGRIARDLPHVRLIFVLRDPTERAYSDYWMDRPRGRGPSRFRDVLTDPVWRERYIDTGHYAAHLQRFRDVFDPEQLLILTFDELTAQPQETFRRICRYLGVADAVVPDSVGSRVNPHITIRSLWLRNISRSLPRAVRDAIGRLNTQPGSYPPMPDDVELALREHYAVHNARLAELLGLDLSAWNAPARI